MTIAILGSGRVGTTLARRWSGLGQAVVIGSREPQGERVRQLAEQCGPGVSAASIAEAVAAADVVVLAVPWSGVEAVLAAAGDFGGRVLIDATNPIELSPDGLQAGLTVGHTTSGGEQVAERARNARVVKTLNTFGTEIMADPVLDGDAATAYIAGDDPDARATAADMVSDLGFEPVETGPLSTARLLEPLAMLWIHLCYAQGMGAGFAINVEGRSAD